MNLRGLIQKILLQEAKKVIVKAKPSLSYTIDFRYTAHAEDRKFRRDLENYSDRPIEKYEIVTLMQNISTTLADHIMTGDIVNGVPFVVKSLKWELAFAVHPVHEGGLSWRFFIKTVFRESADNKLKTGMNQLVINV